jgi:hypothetical protein
MVRGGIEERERVECVRERDEREEGERARDREEV